MDATSIVALVALLVALIATSVEYLSFRGISQKIDEERAKHDAKGSIGEQIGDWLLYRENEGEPSNLDVVADRVAHAMVVGVSAQAAGLASGDSRRKSMVENKLFNAVSNANPNMKVIGMILEKLGLEELNSPELMPYVIDFFRKNGGTGLLGQGLSSRPGKASDPFKV